MKRNLLLLLVLCMVHNIMAQTVIVCNTEGELPKLLSEKAQEATELVIRGVVSADDIKALNNYPKIKSLDLTDAQLLVIPSKAWDDLHSLQELYLPKAIDTLYLDAISCNKYNNNWIDIYLPGKFPYLKNYPKVIESAPDYYFSLTYDNDVLVHDKSLGILSKDRKILYKVTELGMMEPTRYSVERVCNYAFAQTMAGNGGYMEFSSELKEISNSAFVGMIITSTTRGELNNSHFCVIFESSLPPKKTGEGNLNIGIFDYEHYDALAVIVPSVETYINDDSTWGDLQIFSTNDWYKYQEKWNGIENSCLDSKTSSPYYDLQGRKVAHPTRGIYIKDGKKVVIK